jgi:hypothetical protein
LGFLQELVVRRPGLEDRHRPVADPAGPSQVDPGKRDFRAKNPHANVGVIVVNLKTNCGGQYEGKAASTFARA